jgi:exonuclease III
MFNLEKITISSINCNSLNMSQSAKWNQTLKICGITKLKSDIIFLSDIRISNKNLVSSGEDLKKCFLNNPYGKYEFHYNSTRNKRGVGILINSNLQIEILDKRITEDENLILLRTKLAGTEVILISIYGPNTGDPQFFENLSLLINEFDYLPVIIGGDWNCCYSIENLDTNPDCINMSRLPNHARSVRLRDICERFELTDPYRFLYPDSTDFTYSPRCDAFKNKSRLDYFIVSDSILNVISSCKIQENLQNKLFDHKAITLTLNEQKNPEKGRPTISNKELSDDLLEFVVKTSVSETYVIHSNQDLINGVNRNYLLNTCGTVRRLIRDCGPEPHLCTGLQLTNELIMKRNRIRNRIRVLTDTLNLQVFESLELSVDPSIFMETLLNNVKNDTISHQAFIRKCKKEKLNWLLKKITDLKSNYRENEVEIREHEKVLNLLSDADMRADLSKFRHYDIINTEKMTPKFLSLTKGSKKNISLDSIRAEDGTDFARGGDRYRYIREFYQNIYRDNSGDNVLREDCIYTFFWSGNMC